MGWQPLEMRKCFAPSTYCCTTVLQLQTASSTIENFIPYYFVFVIRIRTLATPHTPDGTFAISNLTYAAAAATR